MARVRIQKQLEQSITPNSIIMTDASNEAQYVGLSSTMCANLFVAVGNTTLPNAVVHTTSLNNDCKSEVLFLNDNCQLRGFVELHPDDNETIWGEILNNDYLNGNFSTLFPSPTYDYSAGYHPQIVTGTTTTTTLTNINQCRPMLINVHCPGMNINLVNTDGVSSDLSVSVGMMYQINGGAFTTMGGFATIGGTDGSMTNLLKVIADEISLNSEALSFSTLVPAGGTVTIGFAKYISLRSTVPALVSTYFAESQPSKWSFYGKVI